MLNFVTFTMCNYSESLDPGSNFRGGGTDVAGGQKHGANTFQYTFTGNIKESTDGI